MKKLLSIILSVVMLLTVSVASVAAYAETFNSIETTKTDINIIVQVNGKTTTEVKYERDKDNDRIITFTYTGTGTLIGWEFEPGLTEGKEYKILSQEGNSITIEIINGYTGDVIANAIIKEEGGNVKPNPSPVSPKTGAVSTLGVAAMGAGVAVLAAAKKKRDAE